MKLKEIKAMFAVGQRWRVTREGGKPLVVHGNLGTTTLPANNGATTRQVEQVKSCEVVWTKPDGKTVHMPYPKATDMIEARDGFLKFKYPESSETLTFERL